MAELVETMPEASAGRRTASLAALVVANLLPLAGVLFLSWDVASLMILYWSENLVLGFYTLLKMLVVSPAGALFSGPFFLIHYGGFCGMHGLFLVTMLLEQDFDPIPAGDSWPLFLVFPQILFNVCAEVLRLAPPEWILAFAALFLSHGISFTMNFLRGPERDTVTVGKLMGAPYGRIVVLHVAIIVGGIGVMALGQPLYLLVVLVLLKLAMDVTLHLREHRKLAV